MHPSTKFFTEISPSLFSVWQLGTFMNTVKRILEVLHCRVEDILKPWASCLPVVGDRKSVFGEQLNEVTVMLRTKYKNYMQATVEKLISNVCTVNTPIILVVQDFFLNFLESFHNGLNTLQGANGMPHERNFNILARIDGLFVFQCVFGDCVDI